MYELKKILLTNVASKVTLALILFFHAAFTHADIKQELHAPSEKTLHFLDERYQWVKDNMDGSGLKAMRLFVKFRYSRDDMLTFGLWYLSQAKHPLDFERASWFILSAFDKAPGYTVVKGKRFPAPYFGQSRYEVQLAAERGEIVIENNPRFTKELELRGGMAAAIAANHYANVESPEHNIGMAFELHKQAGNVGIQESLLFAAYLFQTIKMKSEFLASGYDIEGYKSAVEAHFRFAVFACNPESMKRELYPATEENCREAKEQHDLARAEYEKLVPNYWDDPNLFKSNSSKLTATQVGVLYLMGVIAVGLILDEQTGGTGNAEDVKAQQERFRREQAKIQNEINTDLAIGWVSAP